MCGANSTPSGPKSAGVWTPRRSARDLGAVDVDPPRQGGQRAADAQAAAERIEDSVLPRRSDEWDPGRDLAPVEPGECAPAASRAEPPPRAEFRLPALPARGRDRDPVARHADLETASIPTELDFGRYRHAQEATDSMSIQTVDTRASAAARWFGNAPPKPAYSRSRRDRCPTIRAISR